MAKKPVTPGQAAEKGKKDKKPKKAEKKKTTNILKDKGVSDTTAKHLSGEEDESDEITLEQIAERRIKWQKTLPKDNG